MGGSGGAESVLARVGAVASIPVHQLAGIMGIWAFRGPILVPEMAFWGF